MKLEIRQKERSDFVCDHTGGLIHAIENEEDEIIINLKKRGRF